MPLDVSFEKAKAEEYLAAILNKTPLSPPETLGDYLTLSGVCHFVVRCTDSGDWPRKTRTEVQPEHYEAQERIRTEIVRAAIEFYGVLAARVYNKAYDKDFDSKVVLTVAMEGEKPTIVFHKGNRGAG